jgi:hypothetical protein
VGSGSPLELAGFGARTGLAAAGAMLATDPTLEAFRLAGLSRSVWGTFGPSATLGLLRAMGRGHPNSRKAEGDRLQQGGTLLVGTTAGRSEVLFFHRSERLGDHAPLVDVLEAVLRRRALASPLP